MRRGVSSRRRLFPTHLLNLIRRCLLLPISFCRRRLFWSFLRWCRLEVGSIGDWSGSPRGGRAAAHAALVCPRRQAVCRVCSCFAWGHGNTRSPLSSPRPIPPLSRKWRFRHSRPPNLVFFCWARCLADAHLKCLSRRRSPGSASRSQSWLGRWRASSHGGVSSRCGTVAHSLVRQGFTMYSFCRRRRGKAGGLAHPLPREFPEEDWTSALRIVPSTRFHSAPFISGAPRRKTA